MPRRLCPACQHHVEVNLRYKGPGASERLDRLCGKQAKRLFVEVCGGGPAIHTVDPNGNGGASHLGWGLVPRGELSHRSFGPSGLQKLQRRRERDDQPPQSSILEPGEVEAAEPGQAEAAEANAEAATTTEQPAISPSPRWPKRNATVLTESFAADNEDDSFREHMDDKRDTQ